MAPRHALRCRVSLRARRHRGGASLALPSVCESHRGSPVQTLASLHWWPGIGRRYQCYRAWPVAGNTLVALKGRMAEPA